MYLIYSQRADDVVSCQGKLEYLIVASQEITASTAQLFVSSRVKADRESQRLKELSAASCLVNNCTANIVATVKKAQITLNEQSKISFYECINFRAVYRQLKTRSIYYIDNNFCVWFQPYYASFIILSNSKLAKS